MNIVVGAAIFIVIILETSAIYALACEKKELKSKFMDEWNSAEYRDTQINSLDQLLIRKNDEIAELKKELASERRLQQIWRARANEAWQNGYIAKTPVTELSSPVSDDTVEFDICEKDTKETIDEGTGSSVDM